MLLAASGGCATDPLVARDEQGCWSDPAEAWNTLRAHECGGVSERCDGVSAANCNYKYDLYLSVAEAPLCFDGCKMDACIEALREASISCGDNGYVEPCFGWHGAFGELIYGTDTAVTCDTVEWE